MTPSIEKEYSVLALQVLLNPPSVSNPLLWAKIDWSLFVEIIKKGKILIRTKKQLDELKIPTPPLFQQWVEEEEKRIRQTIKAISQLSAFCRDKKIPHLFTKAFQHYPDMGHDIDLLVLDSTGLTDDFAIKTMNARLAGNSLTNKVARKTGYDLPLNSPLEIHHGLLGHVGEYDVYPRLLIERALTYTVNGDSFPIPSPEDKVIIQALQRIYGHFVFRLSDIIAGIELLKNPSIQWDLVAKTAHTLGISTGLNFYLAYLKDFQKNSITLQYKKDGFPIPRLVILKAYLNNYFQALFSWNWRRFAKLSMIPFLAFTIIIRNIKK